MNIIELQTLVNEWRKEANNSEFYDNLIRASALKYCASQLENLIKTSECI